MIELFYLYGIQMMLQFVLSVDHKHCLSSMQSYPLSSHIKSVEYHCQRKSQGRQSFFYVCPQGSWLAWVWEEAFPPHECQTDFSMVPVLSHLVLQGARSGGAA